MSARDPLFEFLREAAALCLPELFASRTLAAIARLIPCDLISYNAVDHRRGVIAAQVDRPVGFAGMEGVFERYLHEQPLLAHYTRTGDGRAVRISDFLTRRQYHRLDIYQELYRRLGTEHQMSIVVGGGDGTVIAIALNRGGSDFSDAERRLLDRARGPLAVAHANAEQYGRVRAALDDVSTASGRGVVTLDHAGRIEHAFGAGVDLLSAPGGQGSRLPEAVRLWLERQSRRRAPARPLVLEHDGGRVVVRLLAIGGQGWVLVVERESTSAVRLSPREREVLALVADGATDVDVGSRLGLSARTVQKHLEHVYERLGVANRTAAVTRAIRLGLVHLIR